MDWQAVLRGALVAMVGALLTFLASLATTGGFGEWSPFIGAALSVVANAFRKWAFPETKPDGP